VSERRDGGALAAGWLRRTRPRWLAAGVDRDDLARLEAAAGEGASLDGALSDLARLYEDEAAQAEATGHDLSAVGFGLASTLARGMRASAARGAVRAALRAEAQAAYDRWAPRQTPPASALTLGDPGRVVRAHLRVPASRARAPVVVLVPPADGGPEEVLRLEERLLARGLATLAVDPAVLRRLEWERGTTLWWRLLEALAVASTAVDAGRAAVWGIGPARPAVLVAGAIRAVEAVAVADTALGGRNGKAVRTAYLTVRARAAVAVVAATWMGAKTRAYSPRLSALAGASSASESDRGDGEFDEFGRDAVADWLADQFAGRAPGRAAGRDDGDG
jgi:hypothetical protein